MTDFDPFTQTFSLIAPDGATEIPVSIEQVNEFHLYNLKTVINYSAQAGSCFILLLVLICMSPTARFAKVSQWLHITALTINTIRMVLLSVYFTSNWNDFYAFFAVDYSRITSQDYQRSVATEIISLIVSIMVQAVLGLQAWAMVNLLPDFWKWLFVALSACVSLAAIGVRLTNAVGRIECMLTLTPAPADVVSLLATIMGAVSIFYYCALFNVKLVSHLIKNRRILPSRQGLSAVEVLVITNGILMIIPVIFSAFGWRHWEAFEPGSLAFTSVILFLPLGTLIAQRIATPTSYYDANGHQGASTGHSGSPFKDNSQVGSDVTESNAPPSTLTSRIEAGRSRHPVDPIDLELQQIDGNGTEKGMVRVNCEFERRDERI